MLEEGATTTRRTQAQRFSPAKSSSLFLLSKLSVAVVVLFSGLTYGTMVPIPPALSPPIIFVLADNIQGTPGDDTLNGTPKADTINGFEGNDIIYGKAGNDVLDGSKGDDQIYGGDGNDKIKDGNDGPVGYESDYGNKVYGGSGNDNINLGIDYERDDYYYVYGEDGVDYINVISNADIHGGPKDDTIYCTGRECLVYGDEGNDKIHVEAHDAESSVSGGSGNDKIYFKGGGGYQSGDNGNDYIFVDGGGGDLQGGKGDDILEATGAANYYNGGPGADNFKCSSGPGDVVEDYNPAEGDVVSSNCETV